jgi:hypothetical protein
MASPDFPNFWLRLIKLVVQTVRSKDDEEVNQKAYEHLKNLLMVVKQEERLSTECWMTTWEIASIENLRDEVDPPASVPNEQLP